MTTSIAQMNSNAPLSLYIPRISAQNNSLLHIHQVFDQLFGRVKRIDYNEPVNNYMSIFVHFDYWYDCCKELVKKLENNDSYRHYVSATEYWIFLKNKTPIPDTLLNIHQIAENAKILEKTVIDQSEQINRLQQLLYQVIGTIYTGNEKNQMNAYFNDMMNIGSSIKEENYINKNSVVNK